MPIISVFFGIVIRIYHNDHNPPHFHAVYGNYNAAIAIHAFYGEFKIIVEIKTGKILGGKFPPKALKLIEEWRKKHVFEINSAWTTAMLMKAPKRIRGLE